MSERGGFDWEGAEDLTLLSREELEGRLGGLVDEEGTLVYRSEILRGRIALIRAELVRRGWALRPPEDLARALVGEGVEKEGEEEGEEGFS